MNAALDGQMPANSRVSRTAAGADSRAACVYPCRAKKASAVLVSRYNSRTPRVRACASLDEARETTRATTGCGGCLSAVRELVTEGVLT